MPELDPDAPQLELKDGSATTDPRLDRLIQFDERSRRYSMAPLTEGRRPRSYTWSVGTWLNQGVEGACVGYMLAHELIARPLKATGIDARYARERLYWEAQKVDPWAGGAYPGASPFYEGTSVLAGLKVAQSLGHFQQYRWSFTLEDLVLGLGYDGPACLGVWWKTGMDRPDANGFITYTGRYRGGHAILAYQIKVVPKTPGPGWTEWTWDNVDQNASYVSLWNSWGAGWGKRGTCRMRLTEMWNCLRDDGEAAFAIRRMKV